VTGVKTANDFFVEWCNGKIAFEDALKKFAGQHVEAAVDAIMASTNDGDDWHGVSIDFDAYPLTKIV
jgi:hypothetical protein